MALQKRSSSIVGPMLLMVVILADIGLLVVGWHIRQQRKAEYSLSGLNLAAPPRPRTYVPPVSSPAQAPAAPAAAPEPSPSGALSSVVLEKVDKNTAAARPEPSAKQGEKTWLKKAEDLYYQMKKSRRFKNSKALRNWKKEFLSHPDLAAIDARYQRDRDAGRYIKEMVRSPSFRGMLGKYLVSPDMQAFIKELAMKPAVMAAGPGVLEDKTVMDTVMALKIPGLPPVSRLLELGRQTSSAGSKNTSAAIDQMKKNPALQHMLQEQGIADTIQNAQGGKR
ncbi:MAG: hypothetical protein HY922_14870 [Elusimicrobia bacterium]|nr:hypothetical protein [Elusimicrobiota bacterium]